MVTWIFLENKAIGKRVCALLAELGIAATAGRSVVLTRDCVKKSSLPLANLTDLEITRHTHADAFAVFSLSKERCQFSLKIILNV